MAYREIAPPPALRGTIACLWTRVATADEAVRVLPDACSDLIWRAGRGAFVAGPDTTALSSPVAAGDVFVGVRFAPGAGGAALGVPLEEVRDRRIDAGELGLAVDGDLDPEAALARLVAQVAAAEPDPAVREAARRLGDGGRVRPLAADLGLSERQLRRRFHAAVGYGPKTLARVLRFRRFLARADAGEQDLAQLAFEAGYADQAHLTRECTRLAGLPPAALMRARGALPPP